MKIVIKYPRNMYNYSLQGLMSTLGEADNDVYRWDEDAKPAYDMVHEIEPDLILYKQEHVTEPLVAAAEESGVKLYCIDNIQPAANLVELKNVTDRSKNVDLSVVTDLAHPDLAKFHNYNIRVVSFGNRVPTNSYVGIVNPDEAREFVCRSKVFVDFDGNNNMMCDAAAAGVHVVSVNKTFFPEDLVPPHTSLESLQKAVDGVLKKNKVSEVMEFVLKENTYFHRAAQVLTEAGFEEEAKEYLEILERDYA
jgi:hypothetical protein